MFKSTERACFDMTGQNMVHMYIGDGKGKTTAAVGLGVRASGAGKRVLLVQFLKGRPSAEIEPLKKLGIDILRAKAGEKFVFQMNEAEREQCRKSHCDCLEQVISLAQENKYDMIILDEAIDAIKLNMIDAKRLISLLEQKAAELVLTGHYFIEDIACMCDYISEIKKIRHPYDSGISARKGIEY